MITSSDAELILRDKLLPGLSILLDPDVLRKFLIRFDPEVNWDKIDPYYIRYKRGVNCLVGYKVGSNSLFPFVYAKTYGLDSQIKLNKGKIRSQKTIGDKQHLYFVEDPAITIHFFPNDNKLNFINRLTDPKVFDPLLEKVLDQKSELYKGAIKSLRYKPERRYVAQLQSPSGEKAAIKFYTPQYFHESKIGAEAFSSKTILKIPRRLGYSKSKFVQIFQWMPGIPLNDLLNSPVKNTESFEKVGVALAELHMQDASSLPYLSRKKEAQKLIQSAEMLEDICPDIVKTISTLIKNIVKELLQEPAVRCPIHGDFYADQVILDGNSVGILDFDRAACGDSAFDLGLFLAHMERDVIYKRVSKNWAKDYCSALFLGYQSKIDLPSISRIELYKIMGMIHLSPEPFRHRDLDWPQKIKKILDCVIGLADNTNFLAPKVENISCTGFKELKNKFPVKVDDPFEIHKDPQFAGAIEALDPEIVKKVFSKDFSKWFIKNGNYSLQGIRVIRYKPSRRCLIEYDLINHQTGLQYESITLLGKVRAKGLDEKTFNLNNKLWGAGFNPENIDGIMVPEPIGCIPKWGMWLYKKAPGATASDLISGEDGIRIAELISATIHKLHNCKILPRRTHSIRDELSILNQCLAKAIAIRPDLADRIANVADACDILGQAIESHPTTGIHRDFYSDQIIIHEGNSYLIDLDLYCAGDPSLDIGNFIGHLTEQSIRVLADPDGLAYIENALVKKFLQDSGSNLRSNIQIYKNLTLARHIYISTSFPDRQSFTESILEHCERRLEVNVSARYNHVTY